MSDTPRGDGWWQASDGKWYAPEQHPTASMPASAPPAQNPPPHPQTAQPQAQPGQPPAYGGQTPSAANATTDPEASKGRRGMLIAAVIVVLLLVGGAVAFFVFSGDDSEGESADEAASDADSDADKDIGDATADKPDDGPIEFDKTYEDALEESRTEAAYTLDAPAGAIMTLTVSNEENSTSGVFTTFESAGERFAAFRVAPGDSETQTIVIDDQGSAEFDLIFTEGPAAFTFEVELVEQDDGGSGEDAGSEFASALSIDSGQTVTAQLGGTDSTDHFTLEVQSGTEFTFTSSVDRDSERGVFFTVELEGERLFNERIQPGSDTTVSLLMGDKDEGTLEVIATEGPATYTFSAEFNELSEGGETGDAPSDLASARAVDGSAAVEGKIGGRDEGDYYLFTAAGPTLEIVGTADAASERGYAVTIEDDSGSRLGFFRVEPGVEVTETFEVTPGSQIRMIVGEGPATYSLTLT